MRYINPGLANHLEILKVLIVPKKLQIKYFNMAPPPTGCEAMKKSEGWGSTRRSSWSV